MASAQVETSSNLSRGRIGERLVTGRENRPPRRDDGAVLGFEVDAVGPRVQARHFVRAVEARAEALGDAQTTRGELDGVNLRRTAGENGTGPLDAVRRYNFGAVEECRGEADTLAIGGFGLQRPPSMRIAGEVEGVALPPATSKSMTTDQHTERAHRLERAQPDALGCAPAHSGRRVRSAAYRARTGSWPCWRTCCPAGFGTVDDHDVMATLRPARARRARR